jgi:hypothetical protein
MKPQTVILSVILILVFAACAPAEEISEEIPVVNTASTPPPTAPKPAPTETEETVVEPTPQASAIELASECTLVSSLPEPPQEYAGVFDVQENDWVKGPEDAAVTLIEYGDFQ